MLHRDDRPELVHLIRSEIIVKCVSMRRQNPICTCRDTYVSLWLRTRTHTLFVAAPPLLALPQPMPDHPPAQDNYMFSVKPRAISHRHHPALVGGSLEGKRTRRRCRRNPASEGAHGVSLQDLLPGKGGKVYNTVQRILQNIKSCRLSAPCCHESPSPTAAAPPAAPPGGPPRIRQNTPRECSWSTNNYTHVTLF